MLLFSVGTSSRIRRGRGARNTPVLPGHGLRAALSGRRRGRRGPLDARNVGSRNVPVPGTQSVDCDAEDQEKRDGDAPHQRSARAVVMLAKDIGALSLVGVIGHDDVLQTDAPTKCNAWMDWSFPRVGIEAPASEPRSLAAGCGVCRVDDLSTIVAAGNSPQPHAGLLVREHFLQMPDVGLGKLALAIKERS